MNNLFDIEFVPVGSGDNWVLNSALFFCNLVNWVKIMCTQKYTVGDCSKVVI